VAGLLSQVQLENYREMEMLTREIMNCLLNKLWYAGLVLTLMLPDVCGALESKDGKASRERYKAWFDASVGGKSPPDTLNADEMYYLRCGVAHQGKFDHPAMEYERIFFTLRPGGMFFHCNVFNNALNLDIAIFCKDVIDGAEAWFALKKTDENVQRNLANLVQFHPNGLSPYLPGVPAVG
jgi:hypothetical protein